MSQTFNNFLESKEGVSWEALPCVNLQLKSMWQSSRYLSAQV